MPGRTQIPSRIQANWGKWGSAILHINKFTFDKFLELVLIELEAENDKGKNSDKTNATLVLFIFERRLA